MVTAIKLDDIAKAMGDVVSAFTDDPVGFVVDFGVDIIHDKVNDLMNCYKGLSGQAAPKCSELNTLKACESTATSALSAAKVANKAAMTATNVKRLEPGLGKVDNVLSVTSDMCKRGCEGGVCGDADGKAAETLIIRPPTSASAATTQSSMKMDPLMSRGQNAAGTGTPKRARSSLATWAATLG